jgi:amidase
MTSFWFSAPVLAVGMLLWGQAAAGAEAATEKAPPAPAAQPFELIDADLAGIQAAFAAGALSVEDLTRYYLRRIAAIDTGGPAVNSLIAVSTQAREQAGALDAGQRAKGRRGPLWGIPVVVKDNIDTLDLPTTGGSAALRGHEPFRDATVVQRLRDAGAIIIAKANLSEMELPYGRYGYSSAGGQTRNPYNLHRTPSSSGVGAAVSVNLAALGLGTDTIGSLRGSAAVTALVGIRPTLGLTSRSGVIPTALSLDVTGPVARSVRDAAILLGVIAGADESDPRTGESSLEQTGDYTRLLDAKALKGARLGVARDYRGGNREVDAAFEQAVKTLKAQGAETLDIKLPAELMNAWDGMLARVVETEFRDQIDAYLTNTEGGMPHDLAELLRMSESPLILGSDRPVHPARLRGYRAALRSPGLADLEYLYIVSNRLPRARADLASLMDADKLDALVLPTMLCPASSLLDDYDSSYQCDVDDPYLPAYLASATGFPEITLPMAYTGQGLPLGLSLLGRPYAESRLLAFAYAFEQATRVRRPPDPKPLEPPPTMPPPEPDGGG